MAQESQSRHSALTNRDADVPGDGSNLARLDTGSPIGRQDDPASPSAEVMQRFWQAVKRVPAYIRLTARIARDPDVPKSAKTILALGGGYAVSPIDLVPGIIPVAGQLDDLFVLLTAIRRSLTMMPDDVADRHLAAANVSRQDIEADLQAVRGLVREAALRTLKIGGKALGRISRAAYGFASEQLRRHNTGRSEKPL